jgi:putative ubiquitin-RnfH superfamily antitoxin RatB of RatAB toxin-antitoxin module
MQSSGVVLQVSVVYALPDKQIIQNLSVSEGCTVEQAVAQSGLLTRFPEIARTELHCAIYGRVVPLDRRLESGDRVELLRPLLIDPKESRRRAAARGRGKPTTR